MNFSTFYIRNTVSPQYWKSRETVKSIMSKDVADGIISVDDIDMLYPHYVWTDVAKNIPDFMYKKTTIL